MPDSRRPWGLENFLDRLDQWIELESPSVDLSLVATAWIMTRYDQPYEGVRRQAGFDNLWFGPIPGTFHGDGQVVACSFWISEVQHRVRCDSFASLGWPI